MDQIKEPIEWTGKTIAAVCYYETGKCLLLRFSDGTYTKITATGSEYLSMQEAASNWDLLQVGKLTAEEFRERERQKALAGEERDRVWKKERIRQLQEELNTLTRDPAQKPLGAP